MNVEAGWRACLEMQMVHVLAMVVQPYQSVTCPEIQMHSSHFASLSCEIMGGQEAVTGTHAGQQSQCERCENVHVDERCSQGCQAGLQLPRVTLP